MKKMLCICTVLIMFACVQEPLRAQIAFNDFKADFQAFADGVASSLPFNAAIGLQWADAYIGNFPYFGVNSTIGITFIPLEAVDDIAAAFGIDFMSLYPGTVGSLGMPFPGWCMDARIGGFGLPFDIGIKAGYLPEQSAISYLLVGADFRYGIIIEDEVTPGVSVGIGFNYMSGQINYDGVTGGDQIINTGMAGSLNYLRITNPNLLFRWQCLSIDVKAQLSKNISFITPYIGVAASYSVYAEAGGGLSSEVQHADNTGGPWNELDSSEIETLESALDADISGRQIIVMSAANGWGLRACGGISFNISIFKLGIHYMYNILNNTIGLSFNLIIVTKP